MRGLGEKLLAVYMIFALGIAAAAYAAVILGPLAFGLMILVKACSLVKG